MNNLQIWFFFVNLHRFLKNALVAELADAPDLGSGALRREGSSPFRRTLKNPKCLFIRYLGFFIWIFAEFLPRYFSFIIHLLIIKTVFLNKNVCLWRRIMVYRQSSTRNRREKANREKLFLRQVLFSHYTFDFPSFAHLGNTLSLPVHGIYAK